MAVQSLESLLLKSSGLKEKELHALYELTNAQGQNIKDILYKKPLETPEEALEQVCRALDVLFLKEVPLTDISAHLVSHISINYAKKHEILPFQEKDDKIQVLVSNPLNYKALEELRVLLNKDLQMVVTTKSKLQDAINYIYEKATGALEGLEGIEGEEYDLDDPVIDLLETGDDEAPVIKLINTLLFRAVKENASDIHIEPYEKDMVVRFRLDGVLYDVFSPPKKLQNTIVSRIKVMSNLNIAEKRLPQDGRIPLRLAGRDVDVRVNVVPTAFGERVVMRLQDRSKVILSLEDLGFAEKDLSLLHQMLQKPYGIILVTGPTGSGKSTTLYSCLTRINTVDKNIITVEQPVEQRIRGIGQIQVNHKIGLTFASALRAILRQDPNVIMIGEIRDLETAEIAINASLTGHLVLSTIHTNDSAGVFPRLIDMGCEPFLIATSLLGVMAQRLVRVLCEHCKEAYTPTDQELQSLGLKLNDETRSFQFYRPKGCRDCNQKGYGGRTLIEELMLLTDDIRTLVMQRRNSGEIRKAALNQGMVPIRLHGIQKVIDGVTSTEEILANTQVD